MENEKKICGRDYHTEGPRKGGKGRGRVIVSGIMHPAGKLPIRFKSVDRAERHIRNHRLKVK